MRGDDNALCDYKTVCCSWWNVLSFHINKELQKQQLHNSSDVSQYCRYLVLVSTIRGHCSPSPLTLLSHTAAEQFSRKLIMLEKQDKTSCVRIFPTQIKKNINTRKQTNRNEIKLSRCRK